ncbi:Uncharacterised protein [uncultured archaeon]|nr:Uncharacterised protein [uncultured archaeon]
MATCVNCGRTMDFAGADGLCESCAASSPHGIGTPAEVPCQRCGMYLPPHELRMHNSRLYCAYCIMDIMDEEKFGKERKSEQPHVEEGGGIGGLFGGKNDLQQYPSHGTCERCGRQSDTLYGAGGRKLCPQCYFEGGGEVPSRPSAIGQIVSKVKGALGMKDKPKIIPAEEAPLVFDLHSRKMVEKKLPPKKEKPEAGEASTKDNKPPSPPPSSPFGAPPQKAKPLPQQGVFDISDRKLVEKKEGMDGQQPISEERREEKKPNAKAKKFFFKLHPGAGEKGKKK